MKAAKRPGQVSLERALSKLGLASRTEARRLIEAGHVRVGGKVVRDPARWLNPERSFIEIEGQVATRQTPVYILLHKPRGVVTTRSDERGRPTVYSLLAGLDAHVVPAGRLDLASTGLLILTNDTRFSAWITDPENKIPRIYAVTVSGELSDAAINALLGGVRDRGELLAANDIAVRKRSSRETHLSVELLEGKNREIRRLMLSAGHEVTALKRISFGGLKLGALEPGKWRDLTTSELREAFPTAPLR